MKKKRISIRFDDRTLMLLEELSNKTSVKVSVVVRSLVMKGINAVSYTHLTVEAREINGKWYNDVKAYQVEKLS